MSFAWFNWAKRSRKQKRSFFHGVSSELRMWLALLMSLHITRPPATQPPAPTAERQILVESGCPGPPDPPPFLSFCAAWDLVGESNLKALRCLSMGLFVHTVFQTFFFFPAPFPEPMQDKTNKSVKLQVCHLLLFYLSRLEMLVTDKAYRLRWFPCRCYCGLLLNAVSSRAL